MDNPDALANLDIAAVTLTMNGVFDARIKELKVARAELDKSELIVKTLDEAQKIKAAAEKDAAIAASFVADITAREKKVTGREKELLETQGNLAARETAYEKSMKDISTRESRLYSAIAAAEKSNAAIFAETAAAKLEIATKRAALESDKKAFNDKLDAMKA